MAPLIFPSVADIITIHERLISEFGGEGGLRDRGLLCAAAAMPQAMFSGQYLHSNLAEMAAAYHYHLCSSRPFVDGNKRVAMASAELFLIFNGFELKASDEELVNITLRLASDHLSKATIVDFFSDKFVNVD